MHVSAEARASRVCLGSGMEYYTSSIIYMAHGRWQPLHEMPVSQLLEGTEAVVGIVYIKTTKSSMCTLMQVQ